MVTLFGGRPELICSEQQMVLRAPITCECGTLPDHLWFATSPEYGHYLVEERGDAFLVAVLIHALRESTIYASWRRSLRDCFTQSLST